MSDPPIAEEPVMVTGWVDAVAEAEANAKAYTDEQVPLIAGRLVPRNMDRAPTPADGEELIIGTGWNQYDLDGDLVQMWRWDGTAWQTLDMAPQMIPVVDIGSATVGDLTGGRINVQDGPIVAGVPDGARVEITGDGLHAYDATGAETARIQGEGGEFVGGEFRTSDLLPGQVTLSDQGYINSTTGVAHPGIRVDPLDPEGMVRPPGVGPGDKGVYVDGGSDTGGRNSYMRASPTSSLMRTTGADGEYGVVQTSPAFSLMRTVGMNGEEGAVETSQSYSRMRTTGTNGEYGVVQTSPAFSLMRTVGMNGEEGVVQTSQSDSRMRTTGADGRYGWVRAQPGSAEVAYVAPGGSYFSRLHATDTEASLFTRAGGVNRYLTVDATGVWVKTTRAGITESWNLEETASDSGWQNFAMNSTIQQFGNPAYRIKGGVVWFRGVLQLLSTQSWSSGWTTLGVVPAAARPSMLVRRAITSDVEANDALVMLLEVGTDGVFRMRLPRTLHGLAQVHMTAMNYPLG